MWIGCAGLFFYVVEGTFFCAPCFVPFGFLGMRIFQVLCSWFGLWVRRWIIETDKIHFSLSHTHSLSLLLPQLTLTAGNLQSGAIYFGVCLNGCNKGLCSKCAGETPPLICVACNRLSCHSCQVTTPLLPSKDPRYTLVEASSSNNSSNDDQPPSMRFVVAMPSYTCVGCKESFCGSCIWTAAAQWVALASDGARHTKFPAALRPPLALVFQCAMCRDVMCQRCIDGQDKEVEGCSSFGKPAADDSGDTPIHDMDVRSDFFGRLETHSPPHNVGLSRCEHCRATFCSKCEATALYICTRGKAPPRPLSIRHHAVCKSVQCTCSVVCVLCLQHESQCRTCSAPTALSAEELPRRIEVIRTSLGGQVLLLAARIRQRALRHGSDGTEKVAESVQGVAATPPTTEPQQSVEETRVENNCTASENADHRQDESVPQSEPTTAEVASKSKKAAAKAAKAAAEKQRKEAEAQRRREEEEEKRKKEEEKRKKAEEKKRKEEEARRRREEAEAEAERRRKEKEEESRKAAEAEKRRQELAAIEAAKKADQERRHLEKVARVRRRKNCNRG